MIKREDIHIRDPFIFKENDKYYMTGTIGETSWGGVCRGFEIFESADLENFKEPVLAFRRPNDFWATYHFWAPEIHKIDNKYYMVASFKNDNVCRASQMLESDNILGPYTPKKKPFTPSNWECLDATLYKEDGILYTIFCHEWTQIHDGEMCLAVLNKEMDGLIDEPITLFKASEAKWTIDAEGPGNYVTDGPFIYKCKTGRLIMIWSSHSSTGYAVGMCYSLNGIKGPWIQIDEPLFKCHGGHGMIFNKDGKLFLSIHQPNTPSGAERAKFIEIIEKDDLLIVKNDNK